MSSVSKSTRILLLWSPEFYIHYSVLYHRYIYHSLYVAIPSTFNKASRWSGREQDDSLESEGSPRISPIAAWFRGHFCYDTLESALLLLLRQNYFADSFRQVDTWSHRILGLLVLEYKCRSLGGYSCIRWKSESHHDCVVVWRILLSGSPGVVYISILIS